MIDVHSHLIPNIDDGSKSLEMTLKMIDIYKSQGVDKIIATPHFYPSYFENSSKIIKKEVEGLNNLLKEKNIDFTILPGSEVYATKDTLLDLKEGKIQTLNDSRYILMEFDYRRFPEYGFDLIYEIHLLGYRVVVAHPERYYYVINDITFINKFIEEGCLLQINTSSLTGVFGKDVKKTALRIAENGSFNLLATDAHTENQRGPFIEEAITIVNKLKKEYYKTLSSNAEMIIKNVEICTKLNKIKEKRSIFDIFKGIK